MSGSQTTKRGNQTVLKQRMSRDSPRNLSASRQGSNVAYSNQLAMQTSKNLGPSNHMVAKSTEVIRGTYAKNAEGSVNGAHSNQLQGADNN